MKDEDEDQELLRLRQKRSAELMKLLKREQERSSWPNGVFKVDDEDIMETLNRYDTVLVDFWAPWCGPCKMIGPVLDRIAPDLKGKMVISKLNVDENQKTASGFNIKGIPTMMIFKDGKPVERITGALPRDSLMKVISKHVDTDK